MNLKDEFPERYRQICGSKQSKGRNMLIKLYSGKNLTPLQAIIAKCCECMGYYDDIKCDCEVKTCPLYKWMPYRKGKKRYVRPDRQENNGEQ